MLKHKYLPIFLLILILTLIPVSSFASGGDGTGGGNGQGLGKNKDIALTLEHTSVKDGAADIAINETIQLDFNKNISNVTVLATNKKCFHLTDAAGNAVAIRLIFPDSQVQHDYREQVFITPLENLKANTQYRISVDITLAAKNGTTIDNAHTITFTTGSKTTDKENKVLKKLGENIITYETAYGETADSVPVNKSGLDDVSQDQGSNTGSIAKIAAIVLILLVIIFTAAAVVLKRRKE